MARGRKPQPPALKVVSENAQRKVIPGPFAQLREAGSPPKPEAIALDEVANAEWERLATLLPTQLSPADLALLTAYCTAWALVVRCLDELRGKPMTVENSKNGGVKTHPLYGTLSSARTDLVRFATELGLTPSERGRVTMLEDLTNSPPTSKLSKWTNV